MVDVARVELGAGNRARLDQHSLQRVLLGEAYQQAAQQHEEHLEHCEGQHVTPCRPHIFDEVLQHAPPAQLIRAAGQVAHLLAQHARVLVCGTHGDGVVPAAHAGVLRHHALAVIIDPGPEKNKLRICTGGSGREKELVEAVRHGGLERVVRQRLRARSQALIRLLETLHVSHQTRHSPYVAHDREQQCELVECHDSPSRPASVTLGLSVNPNAANE
mmetsp:Transcript_16061/g.26946  ORF Transcript_16061/g.26946 Transcript_16061/m.26946 type:complete len:217 (+) Transcript_16061:2521-3171(+)